MKKSNIVEIVISSLISIIIVIGLSFQLHQDLTFILNKFYIGIPIFIGSFTILYFLIKYLFKKLGK